MKPKCLSCPYFSLEQIKLLREIAAKIGAIERLEQKRIELVQEEIEKLNKIESLTAPSKAVNSSVQSNEKVKP
jgi:hypothetical protein